MATEVVRFEATVVCSQCVDLMPAQGDTSHGLQGKWQPLVLYPRAGSEPKSGFVQGQDCQAHPSDQYQLSTSWLAPALAEPALPGLRVQLS